MSCIDPHIERFCISYDDDEDRFFDAVVFGKYVSCVLMTEKRAND